MEVNLISTFAEFKEHKNIDRPTLISVLKDIFKTQLARMYGENANFEVIVNDSTGDIEMYLYRTVVEKVEDPNLEISIDEIHRLGEDYEIGEEYPEAISLDSFGRRGILNLRQNLSSRITDIEKANLINKYNEKIGDILVGEVYQAWKKEVLVMDEDGNELVLPKSEQIPSDFFRKGDTVKAVITSVEMRNNTPVITLSRTSNLFLERLFEQEVPEIFDGLITIRKVVRKPGERAKVAVESYDDRIDPVGACVGVKGSRIHGIVRELRGENIDVINWTSNVQLLVQRALSPAKISSITINEETKNIHIDLEQSELALAIGHGGNNIMLAEQLSGYKIDVYRTGSEAQEDEEDVMLDDFSDEIEEWIIESLKKMGCDTAKSVLALSTEEIMQRADLEEETVLDVQRILREEFEN